jgi:hypothetical protein
MMYSADTLAQARVVAGHVDVLDAGPRQAAVDDRDEDAAVLDAGDGLGERVGLERQDDEGVDAG